jgi:galactokinase/mevalonate kinase-like predicted kinase
LNPVISETQERQGWTRNVWGFKSFEGLLGHWKAKKQRSSAMSNHKIDEWYDLALRNGAIASV